MARKLSQTPAAVAARKRRATARAEESRARVEAHRAHLAAHKVVRADGSEVTAGGEVTSFRGEVATFVRLTRAPGDGTGTEGKVIVRWEGSTSDSEYYPSVFDLKVVPRG